MDTYLWMCACVECMCVLAFGCTTCVFVNILFLSLFSVNAISVCATVNHSEGSLIVLQVINCCTNRVTFPWMDGPLSAGFTLRSL